MQHTSTSSDAVFDASVDPAENPFGIGRLWPSVCTLVACTALMLNAKAYAEVNISPNGYSGLGLIPSARVLDRGVAVINHSNALPGAAAAPKGYNTHIGFGVADGLEFNGRLATQDLHCNLYVGPCPPNVLFRDLSVSMKWSPQLDWLKKNHAAVALGMSDAGGAAVLFKSTYVVASKKIGPVDLTLGHAKAEGPYALLKGTFGGAEWRPWDSVRLGVDRIGADTWGHAQWSTPIPRTPLTASLTWSQSLNGSPLTPKQWLNWGLVVPLDGVAGTAAARQRAGFSSAKAERGVVNIPAEQVREALKRQGFYNPGIGKTQAGAVLLRLENTAFAWNAVDAAGVALGVVAAAYGQQPQPFVVQITQRGIPLLQLSGDAACARRWLQGDSPCADLKLESLLTRRGEQPSADTWQAPDVLSFRPELTLSPIVVSGVGTEYGAVDIDVGVNVNLTLPLWPGATVELNRTEPLGLNSKDFREPWGYFYNSRVQSQLTRRMFHQIVSMPELQTQIRASYGTAFTSWKGGQLETYSQSSNGRHRLSVQAGRFETENFLPFSATVAPPREYQLVTYRYAYPTTLPMMTEVISGKFWAGDKGSMLVHRFWHGDTTVIVYFRSTRANEFSPNEKFAGLQISLPLTPRRNRGTSFAALQGGVPFSYAIETRMGESANYINTGGLGQIPRAGEFLQQTFNRDRSNASYLEGQTWRLKNAFQELTAD